MDLTTDGVVENHGSEEELRSFSWSLPVSANRNTGTLKKTAQSTWQRHPFKGSCSEKRKINLQVPIGSMENGIFIHWSHKNQPNDGFNSRSAKNSGVIGPKRGPTTYNTQNKMCHVWLEDYTTSFCLKSFELKKVMKLFIYVYILLSRSVGFAVIANLFLEIWNRWWTRAEITLPFPFRFRPSPDFGSALFFYTKYNVKAMAITITSFSTI